MAWAVRAVIYKAIKEEKGGGEKKKNTLLQKKIY